MNTNNGAAMAPVRSIVATPWYAGTVGFRAAPLGSYFAALADLRRSQSNWHSWPAGPDPLGTFDRDLVNLDDVERLNLACA
jgi:hypothetical protein